MPHDLHPAEVEFLVSVGSGEEDLLLDETLHEFAQAMEHGPDADAAFLIVKSEYGADGLVKKLIFEAPAQAARFRTMWRAAQGRLKH